MSLEAGKSKVINRIDNIGYDHLFLKEEKHYII
jgi:hypothetical protein